MVPPGGFEPPTTRFPCKGSEALQPGALPLSYGRSSFIKLSREGIRLFLFGAGAGIRTRELTGLRDGRWAATTAARRLRPLGHPGPVIVLFCVGVILVILWGEAYL